MVEQRLPKHFMLGFSFICHHSIVLIVVEHTGRLRSSNSIETVPLILIWQSKATLFL